MADEKKPWETETAPIPAEATLLGSDTQPSEFEFNGTTVPLGDVVQHAFTTSGLTVEAWNELPDDERETKIQAVVDQYSAPAPAENDLDALKKRADELEITYAANIGPDTLKKRIAEAETAKANADADDKSEPTILGTDLDKQAKPHEHIQNTKFVAPKENAPLALVNLVSQGMSMADAKKKLGIS